jgi:adenine-specific DNA-methyltransferase
MGTARMISKNRLELTWIGKESRPRLEPRILIEDEKFSYHADARREGDLFDNLLIKGDNLLALKALESDFTGKVKCIYIDPPYNTGSAFEHYDDGIEHSLWLSLIRDRLQLLRELLTDDGFIFVQIDNNEMAYLKVLMDEVFGRRCFINDIVWKRRGGSANPNNRLNNVTDYILWYSKQPDQTIRQIYSLDDENTQEYIRDRFTGDFNGRKYMLAPIERNAKLGLRENLRYEYNGYRPEFGWMMSRENLEALDAKNRVHWNSKGRPNRRVFLEEYQGQPIGNLWTDIKVINPMALERRNFDGQKPEKLIERLLTLTTTEGDLVLDSFGGSGTTAAVAHKMRRRWIMVELGDHCESHIIPRLRDVIDGRDEGGITRATNWQGGGGFRYFRLAPSLLEKDQFGQWVISKAYNAEMLSEAMCKHFGFHYAPSNEHYWMQGNSSEKDFIYVTTASLTHEQLRAISQEVGDERTLLIACKAFQTPNADGFSNLTLRKIPAAVLNRCEWGKDDYSLKIENLPMMEEADEDEDRQSDLFTSAAAT